MIPYILHMPALSSMRRNVSIITNDDAQNPWKKHHPQLTLQKWNDEDIASCFNNADKNKLSSLMSAYINDESMQHFVLSLLIISKVGGFNAAPNVVPIAPFISEFTHADGAVISEALSSDTVSKAQAVDDCFFGAPVQDAFINKCLDILIYTSQTPSEERRTSPKDIIIRAYHEHLSIANASPLYTIDATQLWERFLEKRDVPNDENKTISLLKKAPNIASCNICGNTDFRPAPGNRLSYTKLPPVCTKCGSLERHRIYRRIFDKIRTNSFKTCSVLMFSRDNSIATGWFRDVTFSIYGTESSIDIQNTGLKNGTYDIVVCNHVLEHVPDYPAALKELARIINAEGFVFLSFPNPHHRKTTIDWGYPKPDQHLHYRIFGEDIEPIMKKLLPNTTILRVWERDPVTDTEDRAYIFTHNRDLIDAIEKTLHTCVKL